MSDDLYNDDPYNLERFVLAQEAGGTYKRALLELQRGRKESHWIWFIFPQLAGLGRSSLSAVYAISSVDEARSYLSHPVLGARLVECARTIAELPTTNAHEVFGGVDAMKLRSSMTLFARAAPEQFVFQDVLSHYFAGEFDAATDDLIQR